MDKEKVKSAIQSGKTGLGIEFGSTRIKAVLIDEHQVPVASGNHDWENQLMGGIWTYSLEAVITGLQDCYRKLAKEVQEKYDAELTNFAAIGISAMMHGYMAFDEKENLLAPFRTWRNAITEKASAELTALFSYNIPQRWSIAHLYQAILDQEEHVPQISFLTTLAGYIHWQLTGEKVLGVGDASGMFPIDLTAKKYDKAKVKLFNDKIRVNGYPWRLEEILPAVRLAGEKAGTLTEEGAKLMDPSGKLQAGVPLCPPEGDAGTGMVATNSVAPRTGNISAGTSSFAMVVLEKELKKVHPEIDLVTTPAGDLVGMVHVNNCTSDINAWVSLFGEFAKAVGMEMAPDQLFSTLFSQALEGDADCGGLLSYGYYSGENITGMPEGRPLFVRTPDSRFNLANFMRTHLYSAFAVLKIGMKILLEEEAVRMDKVFGHGGIFKTAGVAQKFLASAIDTPVSVMKTAGEGGAWGIALLADYLGYAEQGVSLADYLSKTVFAEAESAEIKPEAEDVAGFEAFTKRYEEALPAEKAAVENFN